MMDENLFGKKSLLQFNKLNDRNYVLAILIDDF